MLDKSQKHCWPAGRVCTMQNLLYSIYLAFSVVFSIFWSCNQLRVYGVSSHSFNAFKCLKFLYGCIILLNILWHCNPQLRLLKLGFSVLQCGLYILKFYEWICFRVVGFFLVNDDSRALCVPAAWDYSKHNVIKY